MMCLALLRKNPVERMSASNSSGSARGVVLDRAVLAEQRGGDLVDHLVGALGGEDDGHQQLPVVAEVEHDACIGVLGPRAGHYVSWRARPRLLSVAVPSVTAASLSDTRIIRHARARATRHSYGPGRPW